MDCNSFVDSARLGNVPTASVQTEHCLNFQHSDAMGDCALTAASAADHVGVVRILIELGAELEKQNNLGKSSLVVAAE